MTNRTKRNSDLGSNKTSSSIGEEATTMTSNKIMQHDEFLRRIRRTLYVGGTVPSMASPSSNSQKISRPLADYAAEYFSETHRGHSLNRLNYVTVAQLEVTPCSLIIAMIYLDRLQHSDPTHARKITPTELFLVSMLVSTKFYSGYDEDGLDIEDFADHGEIPLAQMKKMEIELLIALDWNINVSNQEFFEKLCTVEQDLALKQGCDRGWLTYTELVQLFPSLSIAKAFIKYSSVFALSYTASVFTIAGAFLLASQVPGTSLYRSSSENPIQTSPSLNTSLSTEPRKHTPNPKQTAVNRNQSEDDMETDAEERLTFELPEMDTNEDDLDVTADAAFNSTTNLHIPDHHRHNTRQHYFPDDGFTDGKSELNDTYVWDQLHIDGGGGKGSCHAAASYGPLLTWLQFI